jgi:hypothetical protein
MTSSRVVICAGYCTRWIYRRCINPCGFFARADALWRHQNNAGYATALAAEDFWQVNLQAGWRFFHRRAELSAGVLNVAGADYRLSPLNLYAELPRDRVFFTQLKFQF